MCTITPKNVKLGFPNLICTLVPSWGKVPFAIWSNWSKGAWQLNTIVKFSVLNNLNTNLKFHTLFPSPEILVPFKNELICIIRVELRLIENYEIKNSVVCDYSNGF